MATIDREELLHLLNRRRFLAGSAALASVAMMPWKALAQLAPATTFKQGDAEVTVLTDGELTLPLNIIAPEASAEQLAEIAKRLGWADGQAHPSANVPLIKTGNDLILIDTGSGGKFQPETSGKLAQSVAAAGIDPGAVTKVVFTHAHPDHVWGTLSGDALLFPNAAYYVGAAEWDFWMNPDIFNQLPPDFHDFAKGAQRDLGAVKDRVTMLKEGDEIAPGLKALDTPGHTPGHISVELSGGEGLIVTGDSATNPIVSFEHPEWKFGFDAIPDVAIASRKKLLDRAATDRIKLIGYHYTAPGVGFAEKKGDAYVFVAA